MSALHEMAQAKACGYIFNRQRKLAPNPLYCSLLTTLLARTYPLSPDGGEGRGEGEF
jgi:hypothetical protein